MSPEFRSVARAVAIRSLKLTFKNPALIVPSILFPLIFFVAFAGGLSSVGNAPGLRVRAGLHGVSVRASCSCSPRRSAASSPGFGIAADFESRFTRRLFIAAPQRTGLIAGYALAALGRYAFTSTIITVAALISGMEVDGGAVELFGLAALGRARQPVGDDVRRRPGDALRRRSRSRR